MDFLKQIEDKFDAEKVKLDRKISASVARKFARVNLLVAQDQEDDEGVKARVTAALSALGD